MRVFTEEHKAKIRIARKKQIGELVGVWKGEDVSYSGLHHWVRKWLGTPNICVNCNNNDKPSRHYQWANVSGEYKRDLDDWVRLCAQCHYLIDDLSKGKIRNSVTGRYQ